MPMFRTILSIFGTAMTFLIPNSSWIFFRTSFVYRSLSLAAMVSFAFGASGANYISVSHFRQYRFEPSVVRCDPVRVG